MVRKQIYLSEQQELALAQLAALTGENASALIRQAIDQFVEKQAKDTAKRRAHVREVLRQAAGMWKDRDIKEFEENRRSADRKFEGWGD